MASGAARGVLAEPALEGCGTDRPGGHWGALGRSPDLGETQRPEAARSVRPREMPMKSLWTWHGTCGHGMS